MSSSTFFYGLGDFMTNIAFLPFEWVGNIFNYSVIVLGFIGLFYWLNLQKKMNDKAAKDPNQLK
jgi:uncharacterized membrane protein